MLRREKKREKASFPEMLYIWISFLPLPFQMRRPFPDFIPFSIVFVPQPAAADGHEITKGKINCAPSPEIRERERAGEVVLEWDDMRIWPNKSHLLCSCRRRRVGRGREEN